MTAVLKVTVYRAYRYRPADLVRLREAMGLSQDSFATRCGWSQQYQSRLEEPVLDEWREASELFMRGLAAARVTLAEI
jgi:transcriptional regulator with XRE-family HTH domain